MSKELKDTLWKAANKLRGSLSSGQYKDVILGLVFLKHVSDTHWKSLADNAKSPDINRLADEAMQAVMATDPALSDLLPLLYHTVDQRRLGELVELLDSARFDGAVARDLMGEVYEYYLGNFARAEGQRGGEFFTPPSVVRLIVEILRPSSGRVYDPCCGSGGMFVQTDKFIAARDGERPEIYGQESVEQTWRMAKMNLAVHGIDNTELARGDTLARDQHAGTQMDYVMANPPFNIKDWARDVDDLRWRFGVPPAGNANFAWIQHILSKLAPGGTAGVVMANGSMSSTSGGEKEIRAQIAEADLVLCLVALPANLFRSTGIPACVWFFAMDKGERSGQVLFVDARGLGHLVNRAERVLTDGEIARIGDVVHKWSKDVSYQDIPGFCRSVPLEDIRTADYILTPGRYVGAPVAEDDGEAVGDKVARLTKDLLAALDESARLERSVREHLERLR